MLCTGDCQLRISAPLFAAGIDKALKDCVQHFAVDVTGKFAKAGIDAPNAKLQNLVEALQRNCDESRQRRQRLFLTELVNDVLLPFHAQCQRVLQIKDFENSNFDIKLPPKERWVKDFKEHARAKVHFATARRDILRECASIIDPMEKKCTKKAVEERYGKEEFSMYTQSYTRVLGEHLKAEHPEALPSKLRQLLIPDLTDVPTVLRLQDLLRKWKQRLLFTPLRELEKFLLELLHRKISTGVGSSSGESDGGMGSVLVR